jgi:hypothetical protein
MPSECFCFAFFFGTACDAIMFAVALGTNISCSLGRQYRPVFSLSFEDIYALLQLLLSHNHEHIRME